MKKVCFFVFIIFFSFHSGAGYQCDLDGLQASVKIETSALNKWLEFYNNGMVKRESLYFAWIAQEVIDIGGRLTFLDYAIYSSSRNTEVATFKLHGKITGFLLSQETGHQKVDLTNCRSF